MNMATVVVQPNAFSSRPFTALAHHLAVVRNQHNDDQQRRRKKAVDYGGPKTAPASV